jgi:hypothetical protein
LIPLNLRIQIAFLKIVFNVIILSFIVIKFVRPKIMFTRFCLVRCSIIRQVDLHFIVVFVQKLAVFSRSCFRSLLRHLFRRFPSTRALNQECVGPFELYRSMTVENEWENAFAVHVWWNGDSSDVEECWGEINILNNFFDPGERFQVEEWKIV